jgi:hypothetical protein
MGTLGLAALVLLCAAVQTSTAAPKKKLNVLVRAHLSTKRTHSPSAAGCRRYRAIASLTCAPTQFFVVDDLRYQLGTSGPGDVGPGCPITEGTGCTKMHTPNIDSLAAECERARATAAAAAAAAAAAVAAENYARPSCADCQLAAALAPFSAAHAVTVLHTTL